MSVPGSSRKLVASSYVMSHLVRHFLRSGPDGMMASYSLPRKPGGLIEAEFEVGIARDEMGEAYARKCKARQAVLKSLSQVKQAVRRVYGDQPEMLDYFEVARRGRPRKGELRVVKPCAQGDGDVLAATLLMAERIAGDKKIGDVHLGKGRSRGWVLLVARAEWFGKMIALHEAAKTAWHDAIARRNEIKVNLKRWRHYAQMWVTREAMKDTYWSRYLVSWRPEAFDHRFLTKEAAPRMRRVSYPRAWRKRTREEAARQKLEARDALVRRARDAVVLLA